jgi:hypothetical protein
LAGNDEEFVRGIDVLTSVISADNVVEAVSKSVAEVKERDVTELLIAPSSVVSEKELLYPPHKPAPHPVPGTTTPKPALI